jgi:muramoyltetrapeptide carboxypeptidase
MFLEARYLKKGDTIGITCPAGALDISVVEHMVNQLKAWGLVVIIGKTIGTRFHTYSASDEDRLNDLQAMIDNPEIKAIYFGRGGYGVVRIIDQVNFDVLKKKSKVVDWLQRYHLYSFTCT